jgi:hypothetical protein
MVYDPIVEQQLMARHPTTAADVAGVEQQCLQDSKTAGGDRNNGSNISNGAVQQRTKQAPAKHQSLMDSSTQGSKQQQQQLLHHAGDTQGDPIEHKSRLSHQQSSGNSKRVRASRMLCFVGMQATFAVSAAWHLLLFFAVTGTFGWKWMWFFVAQGPLLLLEGMVSRMVKTAGVRVPRMLAVVLTNLLLLVLADQLLITPVVESGVVDGCFRQAHMVARAAMQQLGISV